MSDHDQFDQHDPQAPEQPPERPAEHTPQPYAAAPAAQHRPYEAVTCVRCGYDISGQKIGDPCTECGERIGNASVLHQGSTGSAIAALVLGIVSVIGCMFYGLPSVITGPLAIYFAMRHKKNVREGTGARSAQGMATAGFVCGIIGTVIGGGFLLLMLGFFATAFYGSMGNMPTP